MAKPDEWLRDWKNLRLADYTDPDHIQFYETSGKHDYAYFITSHGFYLQSILEGLVSEWWGDVRIGMCLPWDGEYTFENIRTLAGVTVSGKITAQETALNLRAWKDRSVKIGQHALKLAEGEEHRLTMQQHHRNSVGIL